MTHDNPTSFGAALIRTLLEHGPRDADGEVTTVLIALHDAVDTVWRRLDADERVPDSVSMPVSTLLRRYRPVGLAGVETMLGFLARELDLAQAGETATGTAAALLSSVRELRHLECRRAAEENIPALRLSSPLLRESRRVV